MCEYAPCRDEQERAGICSLLFVFLGKYCDKHHHLELWFGDPGQVLMDGHEIVGLDDDAVSRGLEEQIGSSVATILQKCARIWGVLRSGLGCCWQMLL
jgi:hypothetical protein